MFDDDEIPMDYGVLYGDAERVPAGRCPCDGCVSQGRLPQTRDCVHWQECDDEAGRHGDLCMCALDDSDA